MPAPSRRGILRTRPTSPLRIAGLEAWFEAWYIQNIGGTDGASITNWPDIGGAGRTASQATAGAKPTFKVNVLNGQPVARFDGGDMLQTAVLSLPQPLTILAVWKQRIVPAVGQQFRVIDGGANDQDTLYTDRASGKFAIYSTAAGFQGAAYDTNFNIWCGVFNGAASNLRVAGGAGTAGTVGTTTMTKITLGGSGGGGFLLDGDIAEALIYSRALAIPEINKLGWYLARKYALPWQAAA